MAHGFVFLKDGTTTDDPRLDRVPTGHTEHLDKYPLTTATLPAEKTPIQIGVNWYSNFDNPVQTKIKGRTYWTIGNGDLGTKRGGHATCLKPWGLDDLVSWWIYYDQLNEGRCVEFSGLRMLTLMNRIRYDITSRWHYHQCQRIDYWPGGSYPGATPPYEGTSVDAFMQVAAKMGVIPAKPRGKAIDPNEAPAKVKPEHGIQTYRWAQNWQDVRTVLGVPDWLPGVPMLNSWGRSYPKTVLLMDAAGERVLKEDGEMAVVTDR